MDALCLARAKAQRLVVGIMSGTSCDAIDVALVRVAGSGPAVSVELVRYQEVPFDEGFDRFRLFEETVTVDEICLGNAVLGNMFAAAALRVIREAGYSPGDVDFIGSHGQTVRHLPSGSPGSTLQLGDPSVIAVKTGITTVGDFRPADMAAGGQGAPLLPMVDRLLHAHPTQRRLLLNIGGIANIAVVPPLQEDPSQAVAAFDLGPGNMMIDRAAKRFFGKAFDEDGACAAAGTVNDEVLSYLLESPYLAQAPPKSAGRKEFGEAATEALLSRFPHLEGKDAVATITAFTVQAIVGGLKEHVLAGEGRQATELFVSGGGLHNPVIMAGLHAGLPGLHVRPFGDLGSDADAREAVAFAVLANETVCGNPGNLCSATGAARPVSLGKICLALGAG